LGKSAKSHFYGWFVYKIQTTLAYISHEGLWCIACDIYPGIVFINASHTGSCVSTHGNAIVTSCEGSNDATQLDIWTSLSLRKNKFVLIFIR